MDLYKIEGSNQDRKSGCSTFLVSPEAADTSSPTSPWEMTKQGGQFCLPLGLLRGPSGILQVTWLMAQAVTFGAVFVLFPHTLTAGAALVLLLIQT